MTAEEAIRHPFILAEEKKKEEEFKSKKSPRKGPSLRMGISLT